MARGNPKPDECSKWCLIRGKDEPMIWPFREREDAEDWALDHGLIDYQPQEMAEAPQHHEICARCREPWPCEHERLDREAARILYAAKHICHRCEKRIGGMLITVEGGGDLGQDVNYHGRKGACRNTAMRELRRLGHTEQLERLEAQYREADRQNELYRLARQYKREGLDIHAAYRRAWEETHALL